MHRTSVTKDRTRRQTVPGAFQKASEAPQGRGAAIDWAGYEALARKAQGALQELREFLVGMTEEQARFVRQLRCEKRYSWRAVARTCWDERWANMPPWAPPSNQLMGLALCEKAAELLGEDPKCEPWDSVHDACLGI